jgi:hypothetical protein
MPFVCYIDEAGCSAPLPASVTDIQPVLTITGLIVDHSKIGALTTEFLGLKRKYFPKKFNSAHPLDDVREEIKGSDIRSTIRKRTKKARTELKFLDEVLALLKKHDASIFSKIWIKGIGKPFKARAVYTVSIQEACEAFNASLTQKGDVGFMVADFRTTQLNDQVAHSIFTQKYRAKGDPYERLIELPTFGVSNNHAGLQITDLLCSALIFPIASATYCHGYVKGVHVRPQDKFIKQRYASRIKALQYRYMHKSGQMRGGISVVDRHANRASIDFFA